MTDREGRAGRAERAGGADGSDRWRGLRARFEDPAETGGPVLTAFGLYLASRPDLLPAAVCLDLSSLSDRAPAAPLDAVREQLGRELGADPRSLVHELDAEPRWSRLLVQTHGARTTDGDRPVEVTVARPGIAGALDGDLARVRCLAAEVVDGSPAEADRVVADFRRHLEGLLDLAERAEHLATLEREARGDRDLRFPVVDRRLSATGVLTLEQPDGWTVSDLLASDPRKGAEGAAEMGISRTSLARRLHAAWLRLALGGRSVPVEVRPADVAVGADGRIAFLGGPFTRLGPEIRGDLWSYLETASAADPAEASAELLRLMEPMGAGAEARRVRDRFQHRLRHVVLFRDGGWRGGGEGLAEHLFVQWRLAREAGFRPTPEALLFIRGLASVATLGRRLASSDDPLRSSDDPLRAALERLRLLRGADRLRRAVVGGDPVRTLTSYATLFVELPGKVDRLLGLVESGSPGDREAADREAGARPPGAPALAALAVFVALASIALVAFRLGGADALDPGAQKLASGLLAAFGGALLWVVSRRR